MILQVYSVYDEAAKAYLQPFFSPARGLALRSFSDAVGDKNHQFAKHSKDYTLFYLGAFNDADGSWQMLGTPEKVCSAWEMFPEQA